ncbi:MAG: FHIPEP family type III secretion protein [Bacteroidota bacterium]
MNVLERCHQFIRKGEFTPIIELLQEEEDALSANLPGENLKIFSLSQLFILNEQAESSYYDYLALVLLEFPERDEKTDPRVLLQIISPEGLRNYSRTVNQGIFIEEIEITKVEYFPEQISTLVYQIPKNDRNQRLIEVIERLASSFDFSSDYEGSIYLAESILDKLEVLTAHKEVIPLIGGVFNMPKEVTINSPHHQYFAVFDHKIASIRERKLWVNNKNLQIGRTLRTSKPFDNQNFLLFRLGKKSSQENQIRYIHELRRQHILSRTVSGYQISEGDETLLEREAKIKWARNEKRIEQKFDNGSQNFQMLPVVTPLALEVAGNLIFMFEDKEQGDSLAPVFREKINALRENFQIDMGVRIPSIRVRGNETDLPDGTYLILLNEIAIISHYIPVHKLFAIKPIEELKELAITVSESTTHPVNGTDATWVPNEMIDLLREHDIAFWSTEEYIIQHLQAILSRNLSLYVGVQELRNTFETTSREDLYHKIQESPNGVSQFLNVIHALLNEGIPIVDIETITDQYLELVQEDLKIHEIPEELRKLEGIRSKLRGNRETDTLFYGLHPDLETTLMRGIRQNEGTAILALEPAATQELLTAVRNAIANVDNLKVVIVVQENEIRSFFKKLIEIEFPVAHVMAQTEIYGPIKKQEIIAFD